jgi:Secretory lipase
MVLAGITAIGLTSAAPAFAASARTSAATSATVVKSSVRTAAQAEPGGQRGQLVSVTPVTTLPTVAAVQAELTADGFDPTAARYGLRSYRLVYRTVDAQGRPTTASGLMVLPDTGGRQLSVVSIDHGTESYRGDAPSTSPSGFEPAPAYTFASAGFAVSDPDYLGLGTGPGLQPYLDVPSETTATLDMLRAVRNYLAGHGVSTSHDVLATGFSQGASAALGLGRALAAGADPYFRIGAVAPISGVYDLPGAEVPAILDGDLVTLNPDPQLGAKYTVLYAAMGLVAFNRVHPFFTSPSEIFQAPYAGTIETLLDGKHTFQQLADGTPAQLSELLTPRGYALLRHPTGGLAAALRIDSSSCDWTPRVPVRLYYATGDEQAVNANTFHCQAAFAAHGANVSTVNLGTPNHAGSRHSGSNVAGTAQIVRWFSQLAR